MTERKPCFWCVYERQGAVVHAGQRRQARKAGKRADGMPCLPPGGLRGNSYGRVIFRIASGLPALLAQLPRRNNVELTHAELAPVGGVVTVARAAPPSRNKDSSRHFEFAVARTRLAGHGAQDLVAGTLHHGSGVGAASSASTCAPAHRSPWARCGQARTAGRGVKRHTSRPSWPHLGGRLSRATSAAWRQRWRGSQRCWQYLFASLVPSGARTRCVRGPRACRHDHAVLFRQEIRLRWRRRGQRQMVAVGGDGAATHLR